MTGLRAISVRNPWAHRIIFEGKDIENRNWSSPYRGQLLIQVSTGVDDEDKQDITEAMFGEGGHVIGIVDMVDCVTESRSKWFEGKFGFVLENPRPIAGYPEPCRGALGIFTIRDEKTIDRLRRNGIT